MLNTGVKNHEGIERSHIHCESFSTGWKSMKHSQTNETESALVSWFKQAHASSELIDGNINQEKVLHITAHLVVEE
jgi:FMN-dependent NADH-azoreductase